ncbi:MAG: hypothetical protein Q4A29_02090 [Eubacteriales bacterium]|nr:hypothetical protein [Eubacteriales bacterium]
MRLIVNSMRRQSLTTIGTTIFYVGVLLLLITITNSNSMIYYKISPYTYASEIVDFFFALIVSIPFSYYTFFMKKDRFLDYVSLRMSKKRYIFSHFAATMFMCFFMIFFVNMIGVIFSCSIASITISANAPTLKDYILGQLQMSNPLIFGIIWSFQKALIGSAICLFAQITALYVENLFLALCLPFVYVLLENFFTSILSLSQFSLTTTFILNRLKPSAMSMGNIVISVAIFLFITLIIFFSLRGYYGRKK